MNFGKSILTAVALTSFGPHAFAACVDIGGAIITNVGVISADRTLGTATGDLGGAVGVQIVGESPGPNGSTVFSVHHFWVSDKGDTIFVAPAQLTAAPVAPGLFAVVNYPVSLIGGTGRFKNSTGTINLIGEADFNAGKIGLRYSGRLCYAEE